EVKGAIDGHLAGQGAGSADLHIGGGHSALATHSHSASRNDVAGGLGQSAVGDVQGADIHIALRHDAALIAGIADGERAGSNITVGDQGGVAEDVNAGVDHIVVGLQMAVHHEGSDIQHVAGHMDVAVGANLQSNGRVIVH